MKVMRWLTATGGKLLGSGTGLLGLLLLVHGLEIDLS
jgi:hypothetical protein